MEEKSQLQDVSLLNIFSGTAVTYVELFSKLILNLILVSFLIRHLGEYDYGIYILSTSWLFWLNISNFGLSSALIHKIADQISKNNLVESKRYLSTGFFSLLFVSLLIVLVGWFFFRFHLFSKLLNIPTKFDLVFFIATIICALTISSRNLSDILFFYNRVWEHKLYFIIQFIFSFFLMVIIIKLSVHSVLAPLICLYGGVIFTNIIIYLICLRRYQWPIISLRFFDWSKLKELFSRGFYYFILNLTFMVIFYTDGIVISIIIGAGKIASYDVIFKLYGAVKLVSTAITSMLFSTSAILISSNQKSKIRNLFIFSIKASLHIAIPLLICIGLFGRQIVLFWIGKDIFPGNDILFSFLVMGFFSALIKPCVMIIQGIGKHKMLAIVSVFEALLNLSLSIILAKKIGLFGVALGTVLSSFLTTFWFSIFKILKELKMRLSEIGKKVFVPLLLPSLGIMVLGFILKEFIDPGKFIYFAGSVVLILTTYFVLSIKMTYTDYEKRVLKDQIIIPLLDKKAKILF